jgi:hypothetical protein
MNLGANSPSHKLTLGFFILLFCGLILLGCGSLQSSAFTPTPDIETIDEFFARCPTADEVERVNTDLEISFEYDPTAGTLVCTASKGSADLTLLQKQVYQTIYVMRLLHFSRPLPWTEKQLYDWLVDTIDGIRFVDGGMSHCCEPENTIVIALNENSLILQTDQWIVSGEKYGLMNATLLYAHEARHNEGFLHTCTARNGDDNTLDEMGSWAIQHYLALWIAQYGDHAFLTAQGGDQNRYRLAALQDAEVTRLTRFCKEIYIEPTTTLVP